MNFLRIDREICESCGTCESVIPGFMAEVNMQGGSGILISDAHLREHRAQIVNAIFSCKEGALSLMEVKNETA